MAAASLAITGVSAGVVAPRQACSSTLTPTFPLVVASGWQAKVAVKGLSRPRGLAIDNNGALLVVQAGRGISHITFQASNTTCLVVSGNKSIVTQTDLTHGIALSADGKTLYASSSEAAFAWSYDAATGTVGGTRTTIVSNMDNDDHITRTLKISKKQPNQLLISRGSASNLDDGTRDITTGRSQLRAFNLDTVPQGRPYNYNNEGRILGWGLRNSVGVAEEPVTGGVYSVENSVDNLRRDGVDVHINNPGEELNFNGFLSSAPANPPPNHGYPDCVALWDTNIPNRGSLVVGNQFTSTQTATLNDTTCATKFVAPRLTFQAHMAPLGLEFRADGSEAYVSFHGSWNRQPPAGYKLSGIAFANGEPVARSDSTTSLTDILTNTNVAQCPSRCFRPVDVVTDSKNRLFVSSDSTGEIFVLQKQ